MMAPGAGPLVEDRTETIAAMTAPIAGHPRVAEELPPQTNIAPAGTIRRRLFGLLLGGPSSLPPIKRGEEQSSEEPNDPGPEHPDSARLAHGQGPLLLTAQ